MIKGSKQKRILDWALTSGDRTEFNVRDVTMTLTDISSDFMASYRANNMSEMIYEYCSYVFWLRVFQARLISTFYGDDYIEHRANVAYINDMTNQGFLMLELLSKVIPVGNVDLNMAMEYLIRAYEEGRDKEQCKEDIKELIFGEEIIKEK
ncbi:hypothetical protein G6W43_07075 [Campylobacter concisus]|uniref:hypothetical protein n=1 Tax=Campylobacter concisus TaxID=199 RepID=UPI001883C49F|nr:hypothetical protein [Campylobacter concisus]MBE9857004.1 hypothetical protein [Campylobacter concisus]